VRGGSSWQRALAEATAAKGGAARGGQQQGDGARRTRVVRRLTVMSWLQYEKPPALDAVMVKYGWYARFAHVSPATSPENPTG